MMMMMMMISGYLSSLPKKMLELQGPSQVGSSPRPWKQFCCPPPHTVFQVPVQSWFDDMTDTELLDLIPFFEGLSREDDVYSMLHRLCNR